MSQSDSYAVFGNPVRHSKSPWIHAAFASQCDQSLTYRAVLVEPGGFSAAVAAFFEGGGKGLNVTVPFKEEAFELADELSGRARVAGAVNTMARRDDGSIFGDNTDGVGLVRDMVANLGWQIRGKQALVLGAGGAVRGVLEPLLREQPESLFIANRTPVKARALASQFSEFGNLAAGGFADLEGRSFDIVINGTSASLEGDLPPLPDTLLNEKSCLYDMMYAAEPTPFMRWAAQHAAWAVADGLGMLVEQAAESFYIWRGLRPQTGPVLAELRSLMTGGNQ